MSTPALPPPLPHTDWPRVGAACWLTPPGVLLRRWPDSDAGVVYDARHARTHLLSAAACGVLERCREDPIPLSRLCVDCDAEEMRATVAALEVAGLLLRAPQLGAVSS